MKKTYVTSMPNHIGAFLKASKCFSELGVNISYISSQKNGTDYQYFKMGLYVDDSDKITEYFFKRVVSDL